MKHSQGRDPRAIPLLCLHAFLGAGCAGPGGAELRVQEPNVTYEVSFPAPQTQMVEISIRVPNVTGETLDLALPVWRPGRYDVLDPAGTVRQVRAFDARSSGVVGQPVEGQVHRVAGAGLALEADLASRASPGVERDRPCGCCCELADRDNARTSAHLCTRNS